LTPTLLDLLGFEMNAAQFDGINVLRAVPEDREVYFSGWMQQGPAGFVKGRYKFVYDPSNNMVSAYDLSTDSQELFRIQLPQQQAQEVADKILAWRKDSIFKLEQQWTGKKVLFGSWLCRWTGRVSSAKYQGSDDM